MNINKLIYIFSYFIFLNLVSFNATSQCYNVNLDHIGISTGDDSNTTLIENAACNLKSNIDQKLIENGVTALSPSFAVNSYYLYPILAATDQEYGMEAAFDQIETEINSFKNHLTIVKYVTYSDEENIGTSTPDQVVSFKVYMDLPNLIDGSPRSKLGSDAIVKYMEDFLLEEYNNTYGKKFVLTEVQAFNAFWDKIKLATDFESQLTDLGFEKFVLPDDFDITRDHDDVLEDQVAQNTIQHYGNIKMGGESLTELLQQADEGDAASKSMGWYVTGLDHIAHDEADFNSLYESFSSDNSKLKLFLYFDFEIESTNTLKGEENESARSTQDRFGYVLTDNNLTANESETKLDESFSTKYGDNVEIEEGEVLGGSGIECDFDVQFGRKCMYNYCVANLDEFGLPNIADDYITMEAAFIAGLVDGVLGTLKFLYDSTNFISNYAMSHYTDPEFYLNAFLGIVSPLSLVSKVAVDKVFKNGKNLAYLKESFKNVMKKVNNFTTDDLKEIGFNVLQYAIFGPSKIFSDAAKKIGNWVLKEILISVGGNFNNNIHDWAAYQIGTFASDAILVGLTGGAYAGFKLGITTARAALKGSKIAVALGKLAKNAGPKSGGLSKFCSKFGKKINEADASNVVFGCKIGRLGCFVKDTPVLMASNANQFSLRNSTKAMAVAAAMPIVTIPIQEVQLLDYAVAHTSVNNYEQRSDDNLIASADDTYFGLIEEKKSFSKDPYTSNEQRERDEFHLDDENWNEVVFEEVLGGSTAKLALHNEWITDKGYEVEALVNLDIPEMGISGPFRITSIKHIIPQKKPVDDDEADDYDYKPVTGLFIHEASDVWKIEFDNGEELGVTHKHPIYSTTYGEWQLAGELVIGEEVLTKNGGVKVISKELDQVQEVYNLEVKDYHNFLVNASGVVVHNNGLCAGIIAKIKKMTPAQLQQHLDDGWSFVIKSSDDIVEFFQTRRYFEELMVAYRYTKNGLKSTNPIAHNFKALDAFKETSRKVINGVTEIKSSLAVSMKTTKVSNVSDWLTAKNKKHIDDLVDNLGLDKGILWKEHLIKYEKARLDIYMPRTVFTTGKKASWESHLKNLYPDIDFNISRLEDYIIN